MAKQKPPRGSLVCEVGPPDHPYVAVLRRTDKRVWPWKLPGYRGPTFARDCTHPDGKRAPTAFVRRPLDVMPFRRLGWQDVTDEWRAAEAAGWVHGGAPEPAPPAPAPEPAPVPEEPAAQVAADNEDAITAEDVQGMGYKELQATAKQIGISAGGSSGSLRKRIAERLGL